MLKSLHQSDQAPDTVPGLITIQRTAQDLKDGKIVAWYQGHGEVGPRALGYRSILFNPMISNGKDIINRVKKREEFRPFGASVLRKNAQEYFDMVGDDPYMQYISNVKVDYFPSITHVDGTCRVQTVEENYHFKRLLEAFYDLTFCPVLLNTSFNMAGKPIVGSVEEAKEVFYSTDIDVLVIGDTYIKK